MYNRRLEVYIVLVSPHSMRRFSSSFYRLIKKSFLTSLFLSFVSSGGEGGRGGKSHILDILNDCNSSIGFSLSSQLYSASFGEWERAAQRGVLSKLLVRRRCVRKARRDRPQLDRTSYALQVLGAEHHTQGHIVLPE